MSGQASGELTSLMGDRIATLRDRLGQDPRLVNAVHIRAAYTKPVEFHGADQYEAFLHETNGARMGPFDFWSHTDLLNSQHRLELTDLSAFEWIEIGQLEYEPLFMQREDSRVMLVDLITGEHRDLGFFDDFFLEAVTGPRLRDVASADVGSPWFQLVADLGWL